MRLGIISDMHGNIYALDAVLAELARLGVDSIICNGDIAFGLVTPAATVDRVRELSIPCVRGNTEDFAANPARLDNMPGWAGVSDWFINDIGPERAAWLSNLPLRHVALDGVVLQFHGAPWSNEDSILHSTIQPFTDRPLDEVDALLRDYPQPVITFGHTHLPGIQRVGGRLLINPGSVSYQMWTNDPRARFAILEGDGDQWDATLYAIEYDHERAARVAESLPLARAASAAYQLRYGRIVV